MNPDLNAPVQQAQDNYAKMQGIFAGQKGESQDYLSRYSSMIGSQESSAALAKRIGGELNLPTLQQNAFNTQQQLYDLPGVYNKATTGRDVNANQLSRVIGQKTSELAPIAQRAQDQANFAQNSLNTQMGYAKDDQAKALLPYQSEQQLLSDRLARESSGYSQAMGQELDAVIAKMNAGVTLSEGEKNRASQMAVLEQNYENQKKLQSSQPNTQTVTSGGKTLLIDSATGKVISSYAGNGTSGGTVNTGKYLGNTSSNSQSSTVPSYFKPYG